MKWLKIFIGFFVGLMFGLSILTGAWMYWFVYRDLPSIRELKSLEPVSVSVVLDADGKAIGYYPEDGRVILQGKDIPERLKQAFIAAEDAGFYKHAGLDMKRIISALIADIRANSYVQGASTITQQVVRSYLLSREKTITRKLKEIVLAFRIERALSKDQILDLYLNRLYLGSGAYGVGAASLRYFDKDCTLLSLAETAMIAGLAPAPARYSPLNDFPAAKRRQNYVLTRMIEVGYISDTEAAEAFKEPLMIKGESVALFSRYPYVTDYIKTQVTEKFGDEIFSKGITVRTTISPRLQDAAEQSVRKGAIELEMRIGKYRGPAEKIDEAEKKKLLAFQANQLAWQGPKFYKLYWAAVQTVSPLIVDIGGRSVELGPDSYAWINPKGKWNPQGKIKQGDMVRLCSTPDGFVLFHQPQVQGVLVSFDLETGGVTALVGGIDYAISQFNRAVYAKRQSGSAIKPFIYAAAMDKGFTPSSIIFDTPISFQTEGDEEAWRPKNYEGDFYGATTLRTGLVQSRNVVTVKILRDIGIGYALSYLRQFDMGTSFPRNLSLALGSGVVVPYDLFKGYATFAAYGLQFEPYIIQSISQAGEGTIFTTSPPVRAVKAAADQPDPDLAAEPGPPVDQETFTVPDSLTAPAVTDETNEIVTEDLPVTGKRVISEQTAYLVTNILTDAVNNGTGWQAKKLGRPVAGKTGTSDENRDAWFVGYTPDVLCGVWLGYDDNALSLGKTDTGGSAACPIFTDFMSSALGNRPVKDFRVPDGIVFVKIDATTGKLATDAATDVRFECYKADAVPSQQEEQADKDQLLLKEIY